MQYLECLQCLKCMQLRYYGAAATRHAVLRLQLLHTMYTSQESEGKFRFEVIFKGGCACNANFATVTWTDSKTVSLNIKDHLDWDRDWDAQQPSLNSKVHHTVLDVLS